MHSVSGKYILVNLITRSCCLIIHNIRLKWRNWQIRDSFYRASACLCMHSEILLWQIVRLSVCLSVYSIISKRMHISSESFHHHSVRGMPLVRLEALALSLIATATWLAGWLGGWLGVRHSRYCIKTTKPIWKLYRPSGSPSFKNLGPLTPIPNSKGNPFTGGVKYTGVAKIGDFCAIFDVHRRLSRKRCEIGGWLPWNVNRKSWVPDWMG